MQGTLVSFQGIWGVPSPRVKGVDSDTGVAGVPLSWVLQAQQKQSQDLIMFWFIRIFKHEITWQKYDHIQPAAMQECTKRPLWDADVQEGLPPSGTMSHHGHGAIRAPSLT